MPPKTYWWITGWFLITAPLMIWDAGYCLMRPRSMPGGDLHRFWRFYATYGSVDKIYGRNAYDNGDGFAGAAAIMNLLEISLNLIYLFLVYIFPSPSAPIFGYTGATMTFAKTALYCGQEIFCGWCATGHNDRAMQFGIWILPNM
ncbi:hypothetical protein C8J56DRAFT_793320 [Mycena floridula]|nr:hypothetical protein C8J56DRAFT_793320 [Mycena floridula]